VLPDLSASLDGHVADAWAGTSLGGTTLEDIRGMGASAFTLAAGESMRPAAQLLEARCGVPYRVFQSLTGLKPTDAFIRTLMGLADRADAPETVKRDRARLVDASLDAHFHIGGLKLAIGADPDLLFALSTALAGVGADVVAAVSTSPIATLLERVPADEVAISDLGELERRAGAAEADMLITNAHGRQAAERLDLPLIRAGFPVFDRLGAQDVLRVGYRGTRALLFEVANAVQARGHHHAPENWGAAPIDREFEHASPSSASH
jgi:nitrogenase molybdenum-iron protein NifN